MDIVFIEGLKADAVIGIYDWEREIRQELVLDLELATDIRHAAKSKDINDTLDYGAISERLITYVQASEEFLIETLAENIATLLMQEFAVSWLKLRLSKPGAVPAANNVGLCIIRGVQPN